MDKLIERIEAATGRDVALDAEIGYVVDARCEAGNVRYLHDVAGNSFEDIGSFGVALPAYTASLDAAMTLVPEGWWSRISCSALGSGYAEVWKPPRRAVGDGSRPALALCAASLRARSSILLSGDSNG